ncbi:MAG: cytochrome c maturation protein CcmE [Deferribacteres bacterium]|nr:cytochrome c maturation protein CcmE [candidate division KSB1 bacterium]MCB9509303.1 cytochrome c maturation protein CcmE [Deferribacteres bacterium]
MQRKVRVYIALAVIVTAMAFLMISGFNTETMVYSVTISELKAKGDDAYAKGYRVNGFVDPNTIQKSADMLTVNFVVKDEAENMPVEYNGILPDTFKPSTFDGDIEVLLEGKFRQDGTFMATNIMTKCASKYDPAEGGETKTYGPMSGSMSGTD